MNLEENIQDVLREEGYESIINNAPSVFADACDTVFLKFDNKIKNDIIKEIQSVMELPSNYVFPYYSVTENIFTKLFGKKNWKKFLK